MAAYLEQCFRSIVEVGFVRFYGGPPVPVWTRASRGVSNLLRSRIERYEEGSAHRIIVRDLFAPGTVGTAIKELWRYVNLCQVLDPPYDLAVYGYPGNAWLASLLKRSGRVKRLIYDDWDYHPGLESGPLARRSVENRERMCVRQADATITINPLLARLRTQQGAKQIAVVPNGVNLDLFSQARRHVAHTPTLTYMGSLSPIWGVDLAIRAMPSLLRVIPDLRLLIAGYGPAEPDLRKLSQMLQVTEHVNFLGRFEYADLPSILTQADIGIATSTPNSSFRYYASPLKLIEYMAAGLPVIASRVGQTEITMHEAKAGLLIGHTVEEFVAGALELFRDRQLYERCSQAGISYASNFDWYLLMEKAYQYLVRVLEGDPVITDPSPSSVAMGHAV